MSPVPAATLSQMLPENGADDKYNKSLTGIRKFFDHYRFLKPITVYTSAWVLSIIFQFFCFTAYPFVCAALLWLYTKIHWMKGRKDSEHRWNNIILGLTILHLIAHYPCNSYYTDEDISLLRLDKVIHMMHGVVSLLHFHEKEEMLSYDPAIRFFNMINKYVFLPGCVLGLLVSSWVPNTFFDHTVQRFFCGYCFSTGTALANINRDVEMDSQPYSCRAHKMTKKGLITCHGWQIICAFAFEVIFIFSAGTNRATADLLEYDWEYPGHLYVAYCLW